MRRSGSITFVVSCLLILLLSSCGNLATRKTGAILIALPGAEGARASGLSADEIANAQYEIYLVNPATNRATKTTGKGGTVVVLDNIVPGEYMIDISAHAGNGYYQGHSEKNVVVVENETATASITMWKKPRFAPGYSERGLCFTISRQPEDDQFGECYLIGDENIAIKPNLDRGDINSENWFGEWPFKVTGNSQFFLGGTWQGAWHDATTDNRVQVYFPDEFPRDGYLELPALGNYLSEKPSCDSGNYKITWKIADILKEINLPGEAWCKIGIFDTNNMWVTGTHFTCGQADSIEYQKMIAGGVAIDELTLYENLSAEEAKKSLTGNWYVQCSLFFKPEGENSIWQIELPVQSDKNN